MQSLSVRPALRGILAALGCLLLTTLLACTGQPAISAAQTQPQVVDVLVMAAYRLGWPPIVSPRPDLPGTSLEVQEDGRRILISVAGEEHCPDEECASPLLAMLEEQGLPRGLYHGWEAIIAYPGDLLSADGTLATRGVIAWRYDRYTLLAEDAKGRGEQQEIAEALHAAAQQVFQSPGSTLVLLAETDETAGCSSLAHVRTLAQAACAYYERNAYDRVALDMAFLDADGPAGDRDWHGVGSSSLYANPPALGLAALRRALASIDLPEEVYIERAIVVYAGRGDQLGVSRKPYSCSWRQPNHRPMDIEGPRHSTRLYVPNLVLVAEEDHVGSWVHELGHTLYARYPTANGYHRLWDRYDRGPAGPRCGNVGFWDVMGLGSEWGTPAGSTPVQMCSYSKEAAGWLRYQEAVPGNAYALTALEEQRAGDAVLRLDDPADDDPRSYFIIEARDDRASFGAPEAGVLVYHVTHDEATGRHVVNLLPPQAGERKGQRGEVSYQRPTLHGVGDSHGAREYIDADGGVRITLLTETFSPYKATVRIERRAAAW